jgi:asparagine synthase (glutamine-hydrolysing)
MCGIAGGCWKNAPHDIDQRLAMAMRHLQHRGPDDRGFVMARNAGYSVALCQTRLSIIDLGSSGHQPMETKDGSLLIVFNGEIYNYKELREELRASGHKFSSSSDTEVLLAAWAEWGASSLPRLEGMFAFVVFDRRQEKLTFVRDAFGIKPLFYDRNRNGIAFASEIQALLALRGGSARPDLQRAYDYLVHGDYDSQERSFIQGVLHLPPGTLLEIDAHSPYLGEPVVWWRPQTTENCSLSFSDAADAVREQFLQNVRLHLRSDVPFGAALSGGIDSSAIVCAIRHVEPEIPIHTFSYIAAGSEVSEERWVDLVNAASGAISHKVVATGDNLLRDLDHIITAQGEPFGSTSIYAQYRVFQLAKENGITVTLDGQGADELLAGYNGFAGQRMLSLLENRNYSSVWEFANRWGQWPGRSSMGAWMRFCRMLGPSRLHGLVYALLDRDIRPPWLNVRSLKDAGVVLQERRPELRHENRGRRVIEALVNSLQTQGLPQLLRHGDRNSMSVSIESRVPFLTIPFANLALSMPENYLISDDGETKCLFRAAMRGIVPDTVLDRRDKIGFATPERAWLMEIAPQLRQWISESSDIEFLNISQMLKAFDQVMSGKRPFSWSVWRWVNFCRWFHIMGLR